MRAGRNEKYIKMRHPARKWIVIWNTAIAILAFYGTFFMMFTAVGMTVAYGVASLVGTVSVVLWMLFRKRKSAKIAILVTTGVISIFLAVVDVFGFGDAFVAMLNKVVSSANANMHWGIPPLTVTGDPNWFNNFALAAIFAMWIGIAVAAMRHHMRIYFVVYVIVTLALVCFGLRPSMLAIAFMLFVLGCKCVSINALPLRSIGVFVVVIILFITACGTSLLYSGSRAVASVRRAIGDAADQIAYGSDSLPQGRLENAEGMIASDDLRLVVTMSNRAPKLYLKGFVGSTLDGNEWKETDRNAYVSDGYTGIIDYVAAGGVPFSQYSKYLTLSGNTDSFSVDVKNVGANDKYYYTPYSLMSDIGSPYYDINIRKNIFSGDSYSFRVSGADASSERVVQNKWLLDSANRTSEMRAYMRYENEYRRFVGDTYKDVGGRENEIIELLGGREANSIFTVSQITRIWFQDNYTYVETPDAIQNDFYTEFFAKDIKRANAAYFASAATLIFRAYGYSARYVEGYLVKAESRGDEEHITVEVTGKNSHAWTEVYFDGIGWLPIDVTPTFYSENDILDDPPDPDDPGSGDNSGENEDPSGGESDPPLPPPPEEDPPPEPKDPLIEQNYGFYVTLKSLVIVLYCVLVALVLVLVVLVRREYIIMRKRNSLEVNGEQFGRAAIKILDGECKSIGGYTQKRMAEFGVPPDDSQRFVEIVERAVYGGYDLTDNEREYAIRYIENISKSVASSKNKLQSFFDKYFRCLGI